MFTSQSHITHIFYIICYVCIPYFMLHSHFIFHITCTFHIPYYISLSLRRIACGSRAQTFEIIFILHITHAFHISYCIYIPFYIPYMSLSQTDRLRRWRAAPQVKFRARARTHTHTCTYRTPPPWRARELCTRRRQLSGTNFSHLSRTY